MQNKSEAGPYTRQLSTSDDLSDEQYARIAELIYDTDEYIYPALFHGEGDPVETAKTVLSHVLKHEKDAMFSKDNLFVCLDGADILGLILWKKGRLAWDREAFIQAAARAGIHLKEAYVDIVGRNYFDEQYLEDRCEEASLISVINVCVHHAARGSGVGDLLLRNFIKEHRSEPMELCVLCENTPAIRLYQKYGFEIAKQFPGFALHADKPECYGMRKLSWGRFS